MWSFDCCSTCPTDMGVAIISDKPEVGGANLENEGTVDMS